jgi:diguanylate cyclase (GGDEF)-like protein
MFKYYTKEFDANRNDFDSDLASSNILMGRRLMLLIAVLEAVMCLFAVIQFDFEFVLDYHYLFGYIVLFVVSLLYYFLIKFSTKINSSATVAYRMTFAFSIFFVAWSVYVSCLDTYTTVNFDIPNAHPIVMLNAFAAVAGCIYIKPRHIAIELLSAFVAFTIIYSVFLSHAVHIGVIINIAIFTIVCLVVSIARFGFMVKGFGQNIMVKEKNKELTEINLELLRLNEKLSYLSTTDVLTGLKNRLAFKEKLEEVSAFCAKSNELMSVAIFDLDDFKMVNDKFGHGIGDDCLKEVSDVLLRHIDESRLFRYGGEEFIMLADSISESDVFEVLQVIRKDLARTELTSAKLHVTISAGMYTSVPSGFVTSEHFLTNADRALYYAKVSGKDRVEIYDINKNPLGAC